MYPFRFKMILIIFFLLFTGIVVRLFQLQIIESDKYKGISKTRRLTSYALDSIRGSIVDRHGNVLAVDHHTFDITVQYKNLLYCAITYKNKTISRIPEMEVHKKTKKSCKECHEKQDVWLKKLSQLLNIQPEKLLEGTNQIIERVEKLKQNIEKKYGRAVRIKEETDFYPVAANVAWEKVIQIEINQDNFPGTRITPKPKRIYPEQELAAHILGYMSNLNEDEWKVHSNNWNNFILASSSAGDDTSSLLYDGYAKNDTVGRAGVESQYEEELRGLRGKRFEEIICKNTQIEKTVLERPSIPGNTLYLTLDSQIQAHAEKSLGKNLGAIVVMNPGTGEILAMASNPRFNPNTIDKDFSKLIRRPSKPFLNRAVQGALPPGSIFKIITATAALSSNSITTQTPFECPGYTKYKNIVFRCWSDYGHGLVTLEDAIPYSCNVFFFETAKMLGGDTLYAWAKKFGIGEKTGIDLPHEKSGNLPKTATTASVMNVAIGQGALLTTPLQLVRAYAVIANGGTLVQPHLLLKITNSRGETVRSFQSENTQKLQIPPAIISTLRMALQDVVTRGTAKDKGLDIYKVAGKTGTAETGRHKDNHAWFVGYAPYDNPQYCFAILVEHTSGHGGDIAGPIATELMSYLFPEMNPAS
ncbi:MAG: penicillin-binding protein 2 [Candidatus Brocadia sp. AMX2]|uniref:Penicillin-binding protein n=1 Tax=Candidatus Brocadia sinica JPN1 TaxID=1197129 RepID=A0ABQ0JWM4_9BACT|nr:MULTISPECIES: penicillin-binding protein 2 [Brocadia]KXK30202.1 MAG: penicillin-binding protein [Candidatus Brocadia sinica]MBC6930727.1 penicillin-binding protein 2 [Candidatus Brocadia sp.]MBL1167695.1 penicillin-binding protein 2 [Candidatus Brocadia sp. AMX1]NOG41308.1 penicillin-binding protein 2 [Planctomycetota bacterium]KAA0245631.1 MAG: penicillin-binding protein 2 [Candidatus Brocadia sp. AMX2]